MFSSKPNTVLLLKAKSLEFYNGKEAEKETLEFSPKILKKDEIIDWEKFEMLVEEFLARNSLKKQKAIMILGPEILNVKEISGSDEEKAKSEEEKFFKSLPFKEEEMVIKKLRDEEKYYLIAAHKDFYQSVKYTLEKFGWTITEVVPATMFEGFDKEKKLDFAEVNQILTNTTSLQIGDMTSPADTIKPSRLEKTQAIQEEGLFTKQNILLLFVIAFGCATLVFGLLYFNIVKPPMLSLTVQPTPTPLPTSTPVPTQVFDKQAAKLKVLNGTGTPGQAGKVKATLEDLGFSSIDTGNADTTGTKTTVEVGSNVPKDVADEIVNELKKTFKDVSVSKTTDSSFDVIVTTGEEK